MATETKVTDAEAKRPPSKRQTQVKAAVGWWTALRPQKRGNGSITAGDRATLAKLRRNTKPYNIAIEPAVVDLYKHLKFEGPRAREADIVRAAVLACVLAHVRSEANGTSLARAMAGTGDRPVVSAIRMKRFMSAREPEDVLRQFQRVLAMLGDKANVYDVAENVLAWLDDSPAGDRARTRFAFQYHGTLLEDADDLDSGTTAPATDPQTKA